MFSIVGLGTLVQTYVNAINSEDLPCMENAVLALAEIENSAAVQKAIVHYDQQMGQKLQLPTETLQELLDLHKASEKEAIEVFMKNSFKDVDQVFQKKLGVCLLFWLMRGRKIWAFLFFVFNWKIIALQYCIGFFHTTM